MVGSFCPTRRITVIKDSRYRKLQGFIMQVVSELVKIPNNQNPTVEYIESELTKRNINPLRWAIVHVSDKIYTVSVANLKE